MYLTILERQLHVESGVGKISIFSWIKTLRLASSRLERQIVHCSSQPANTAQLRVSVCHPVGPFSCPDLTGDIHVTPHLCDLVTAFYLSLN